jgi:aminomethyltransferase
LSPFVKLGRPFIGASALEVQHRDGIKKKLIGLRTDDGKMIARQGYRVFRDGRESGVVTSGSFAPSIQRPIAMAYVEGAAAAASGDVLEIEIRNRRIPATVVRRPFYRRGEAPAASTASL